MYSLTELYDFDKYTDNLVDILLIHSKTLVIYNFSPCFFSDRVYSKSIFLIHNATRYRRYGTKLVQFAWFLHTFSIHCIKLQYNKHLFKRLSSKLFCLVYFEKIHQVWCMFIIVMLFN